MPKIQRVIVIYSPHSGRAEQLSQALEYLRQMPIELVQVLSITELDHLMAQGTHWQMAGIDAAIAAGGDGLVGGVASHIIECGLPLGILPLGTANDIARSLNIPQDLRGSAETIAQGHLHAADIGVARPAEQAPHNMSYTPFPTAFSAPSYFDHALTVGLNVQFARLATNVATRQRYGSLTYPFAALEVLKNHTALEMHLEFEGLALFSPEHTTQTEQILAHEPVLLSCRTLQATVINAPIFGGQWNLSIPGASLTDGLLDIVVIEDIDLGRLSNVITSIFNQQEQNAQAHLQMASPHMQPAELTGMPGVHHVRARGVTITTNADPQDVTLDGEIRGQTPIHVQMATQRLQMLVPAQH